MHSTRPGVLIVGGGLIGSSIAWRLARLGVAVTVADAGNLGGEASSAGAGMLSPGAEAETASGGLELGVESLRLYPDFIRELHEDTGLAIEYRTTGCVMLGDAGELAARKAAHRAAGLYVEDHPEGLFYPEDGLVVPPDLLAALRCAARKRGVSLVQERVERLEATRHAAVVIAAGAWSGAIEVTHAGEPVALPPSIPVKGHLLAFDLEPGRLGPFRRRGPIYVLQRASGLVVAGSNEEHAGFDLSVDRQLCSTLHRQASELMPELAARSPTKMWAGFRPGLQPGAEGRRSGPLMRRVEGTNVWLVYGHYRNGILLTPVTAARMTAGIAAMLS